MSEVCNRPAGLYAVCCERKEDGQIGSTESMPTKNGNQHGNYWDQNNNYFYFSSKSIVRSYRIEILTRAPLIRSTGVP